MTVEALLDDTTLGVRVGLVFESREHCDRWLETQGFHPDSVHWFECADELDRPTFERLYADQQDRTVHAWSPREGN